MNLQNESLSISFFFVLFVEGNFTFDSTYVVLKRSTDFPFCLFIAYSVSRCETTHPSIPVFLETSSQFDIFVSPLLSSLALACRFPLSERATPSSSIVGFWPGSSWLPFNQRKPARRLGSSLLLVPLCQ